MKGVWKKILTYATLLALWVNVLWQSAMVYAQNDLWSILWSLSQETNRLFSEIDANPNIWLIYWNYIKSRSYRLFVKLDSIANKIANKYWNVKLIPYSTWLSYEWKKKIVESNINTIKKQLLKLNKVEDLIVKIVWKRRKYDKRYRKWWIIYKIFGYVYYKLVLKEKKLVSLLNKESNLLKYLNNNEYPDIDAVLESDNIPVNNQPNDNQQNNKYVEEILNSIEKLNGKFSYSSKAPFFIVDSYSYKKRRISIFNTWKISIFNIWWTRKLKELAKKIWNKIKVDVSCEFDGIDDKLLKDTKLPRTFYWIKQYKYKWGKILVDWGVGAYIDWKKYVYKDDIDITKYNKIYFELYWSLPYVANRSEVSVNCNIRNIYIKWVKYNTERFRNSHINYEIYNIPFLGNVGRLKEDLVSYLAACTKVGSTIGLNNSWIKSNHMDLWIVNLWYNYISKQNENKLAFDLKCTTQWLDVRSIKWLKIEAYRYSWSPIKNYIVYPKYLWNEVYFKVPGKYISFDGYKMLYLSLKDKIEKIAKTNSVEFFCKIAKIYVNGKSYSSSYLLQWGENINFKVTNINIQSHNDNNILKQKIKSIYRDLYGRNPSAKELNYWVNYCKKEGIENKPYYEIREYFIWKIREKCKKIWWRDCNYFNNKFNLLPKFIYKYTDLKDGKAIIHYDYGNRKVKVVVYKYSNHREYVTTNDNWVLVLYTEPGTKYDVSFYDYYTWKYLFKTSFVWKYDIVKLNAKVVSGLKDKILLTNPRMEQELFKFSLSSSNYCSLGALSFENVDIYNNDKINKNVDNIVGKISLFDESWKKLWSSSLSNWKVVFYFETPLNIEKYKNKLFTLKVKLNSPFSSYRFVNNFIKLKLISARCVNIGWNTILSNKIVGPVIALRKSKPIFVKREVSSETIIEWENDLYKFSVFADNNNGIRIKAFNFDVVKKWNFKLSNISLFINWVRVSKNDIKTIVTKNNIKIIFTGKYNDGYFIERWSWVLFKLVWYVSNVKLDDSLTIQLRYHPVTIKATTLTSFLNNFSILWIDGDKIVKNNVWIKLWYSDKWLNLPLPSNTIVR